MAGNRMKQLLHGYHAAFRPLIAITALFVLVALIAIGLSAPAEVVSGPASDRPSDLALYIRVIDHLRHGESYYIAAVRELRENNYPLRPFVAVRPPVHALMMAALPDVMSRRLLLAALSGLTLMAWAWRLKSLRHNPARYALALMALISGIAPGFVPAAYPLHEVWAGLLIALSLALRKPDRWFVSVLIGTFAAVLRELAAPYLLVMAVLAFKEGRGKESAAWFAGLAVFALTLAVHAFEVSTVVTAVDPVSPTWLQLGGWPFVLRSAQWNLILQAGPKWLGALLVPLALLGLTALRGPLGRRLALTVGGYTFAFLFVGRDNNFYWGLIIAPLWPLGLLTAWPALMMYARDALPLFRSGRAGGRLHPQALQQSSVVPGSMNE
jgi:hypothetical protein